MSSPKKAPLKIEMQNCHRSCQVNIFRSKKRWNVSSICNSLGYFLTVLFLLGWKGKINATSVQGCIEKGGDYLGFLLNFCNDIY